MSLPRFEDHIVQRFPGHSSDFQELETIIERHANMDVRDLEFPAAGPDFQRQNAIFRIYTFTFSAVIRSQRILEAIVREFNELNLHAVYILVRSHLEIAALAHFAARNIASLVAERDMKKLDEFLDQLVLGNLYMSKERDYPVKPFHIGSVVRELDELSPHISHMYYFLSEFSHPNMGALILSTEMDHEQRVARFSHARLPTEPDFMQTINIAIATGHLVIKAAGELLLLDTSSINQ